MNEENINIDSKNIFSSYYLGSSKYFVKHIISLENTINNWQQDRPFTKNQILEKEGLILISSFNNTFNGVYDYKNRIFILPIGLFNNISYSEKNKSFLATFSTLSTLKEDDFVSYLHPETHEEISKCFRTCGDTYQGIINIDGTLKEGLINITKNKKVSMKSLNEVILFKNKLIAELDAKREKDFQDFNKFIADNNIELNKDYTL